MTYSQLWRQRIRKQQIVVSTYKTPAEIVSWLGAVQAQDYLGSLWAIGLRLKAITEDVVESSIARRSFVRTWPMRGTLHFVPAENVRWMLKYLTPRIIQRNASHYKQSELDDKVFLKSRKVIEKCLAGNRQLTRAEVYNSLEQAKISTEDQRGLHILVHLAQLGVICLGTRQGKQHTFTLLDEWIGASHIPPRDEALAKLASIYFSSHGPATVEDFAWWAGLTKTEAACALAEVKSDFTSYRIGKQEFWFRENNSLIERLPEAWLLPPYDEYLVGYRNRDFAIHPKLKTPAEKHLIFRPVLVINEHIHATWKRTINKDEVRLEIYPLRKIGRADKKLIEGAVQNYGAFLKAKATAVYASGNEI